MNHHGRVRTIGEEGEDIVEDSEERFLLPRGAYRKIPDREIFLSESGFSRFPDFLQFFIVNNGVW